MYSRSNDWYNYDRHLSLLITKLKTALQHFQILTSRNKQFHCIQTFSSSSALYGGNVAVNSQQLSCTSLLVRSLIAWQCRCGTLPVHGAWPPIFIWAVVLYCSIEIFLGSQAEEPNEVSFEDWVGGGQFAQKCY